MGQPFQVCIDLRVTLKYQEGADMKESTTNLHKLVCPRRSPVRLEPPSVSYFSVYMGVVWAPSYAACVSGETFIKRNAHKDISNAD